MTSAVIVLLNGVITANRSRGWWSRLGFSLAVGPRALTALSNPLEDLAAPIWHLTRQGHTIVCRILRAPYGGWQLHLTFNERDFFDQYCDDSRDPAVEGVELVKVLLAHGWCLTN